MAQMQTLNANQCFYIVNGVDNLALEVNEQDRYAPSQTGIYDLSMKPFQGISVNNLAQQWSYSPKENTVRSMLHKDGALFEGYNQNVIVSQNMVSNNQKFTYDFVQGYWNNLASGRVLEVKDHQVTTSKKDARSNGNQKWHIQYCNGDKV